MALTQTQLAAAVADRAQPKSTDRPPSARPPRTKRRKPGPGEIAGRAYFMHLEDGESDQLANWLRAERELATA